MWTVDQGYSWIFWGIRFLAKIRVKSILQILLLLRKINGSESNKVLWNAYQSPNAIIIIYWSLYYYSRSTEHRVQTLGTKRKLRYVSVVTTRCAPCGAVRVFLYSCQKFRRTISRSPLIKRFKICVKMHYLHAECNASSILLIFKIILFCRIPWCRRLNSNRILNK